MSAFSYKLFFLEDVPQYLRELKPDTKPKWGVMTPQHMVEHLIYVTKVTMKRYGQPDLSKAEHHAKMKEFILGKYAFPKNMASKKSDPVLKELRFKSLSEAIDSLEQALKGFYSFYEQNPLFVCYNPQMGELDFKLCELFHFKHYKHHLEQFGWLPHPEQKS